MKTQIISLLLSVAACMTLGSCNDDNWNPGGSDSGEGTVSLASMDVDVNTAESVQGRASVNTDTYLVEILNKETGAQAGSYVYGEMPEVVTLPVGKYTVNVRSHEVQPAQWSAPYYVGTKDFEIVSNKITEIGTVMCKFSNIKVTVRYTAELFAMLGNDARVTVVAGERGQLEFTPTETRAAYFEAVEGSMTLVAEFKATIGGNLITMTKPFTDVTAGKHYIITFSVKNGDSTVPDEFGQVNPSGVSVDAEIEHENVDGNVGADEDNVSGGSVRPGQEEWPEEPGPGPDEPGPDTPSEAITMTCKAKLDGTPNDIVEGEEYKVDIHAENGVENLWVTISSSNNNFIASAGELLPMNFDFAHLDQATYDNLASIGLTGNEAVYHKTDVPFDITGLVPLLKAFPGTHTFTIKVVDAAGNEKTANLVFIAK